MSHLRRAPPPEASTSPHAPTNSYDEQDMVRRLSVMRAGPLKIAAYQVRDPETLEFSKTQFHMTYDNHVMAMLDESSAKLPVNFITGFEEKLEKPLVYTDRIAELLNHSNEQLQIIRDQKQVIAELERQIKVLKA